MRIPVKLGLVSLSVLWALLGASTAGAESRSGALPLPAPSPAPSDAVILWDRIAIDGEHLQEAQFRITAFDGKELKAGERRFAAAIERGLAFDALARPVVLEKALAERGGGLCALVQYVPARLSALGADTATGVVLLVNERGAWLERCPDEDLRR